MTINCSECGEESIMYCYAYGKRGHPVCGECILTCVRTFVCDKCDICHCGHMRGNGNICFTCDSSEKLKYIIDTCETREMGDNMLKMQKNADMDIL